MMRREGLPRQLGHALAVAVLAAVTGGAPATAADDATGIARGGDPRTIELPREILPWRRDVEQRADAALVDAERAFATGREAVGERKLAELVRDYPNTYAGREAQQRLEARRRSALWSGSRRGALGVTGQVGSDDGDAIAIAPVAGWQTVVRQGPGNLREALIEAAGDRVFFEAGSATLSQPAKRVLNKQAHWLKSEPHVDFKIIGHADDDGSGASNLRLSHDRAVAVRGYLISKGVSANRLHVLSVGNAQPIAICAVKSCAAQNRRVVSEIRLRRQALGPAQ